MGSKILAICITLLGISLLSTSFAQEEEVEYSWGTVKNISSNQIVVTEYDYDNDEDVEVTYSIDSKVELRGVKILKDIAVGDNLDIEYVIQGGKKVAKVITVEKSSDFEVEEFE